MGVYGKDEKNNLLKPPILFNQKLFFYLVEAHAPKVPPRERKPKEINQIFQKPKVVFLNNNNHALRNHHRKSHTNRQNNNNNPLPNSSKLSNNKNNLSPKSSIEKQHLHHNKTTTTNLSDEMIQMISEREREMFDYHATSRKQQQPHQLQKATNQNTCKSKQQLTSTNNSSITTMEQIYCQKCHLLLPKNTHNNSKSRSSSNSSFIPPSNSCCFWLLSIKDYISKKWNLRRSRSSSSTSTTQQTKKYDKCK